MRIHLLAALVATLTPACSEESLHVAPSECLQRSVNTCDCTDGRHGEAECVNGDWGACVCGGGPTSSLPVLAGVTQVAVADDFWLEDLARVGDHFVGQVREADQATGTVVELDAAFKVVKTYQSCDWPIGRFRSSEAVVTWLCPQGTQESLGVVSADGEFRQLPYDGFALDYSPGGDGYIYLAVANQGVLDLRRLRPDEPLSDALEGGFGATSLRASPDGLWWLTLGDTTIHRGGGDPFINTTVDPMVTPMDGLAIKVRTSWYFFTHSAVRKVAEDGFGEKEIIGVGGGSQQASYRADPYSLEQWGEDFLVVENSGTLLRVDTRNDTVALIWPFAGYYRPGGFTIDKDGSLLFTVMGAAPYAGVWRAPGGATTH